MADNSLHVPDASPYAIDNDGRARSNSIRSQRSTHSASLPPVTENEILENAYDTRPALEGSSRPSIRIRRVSSNIGSSEQQSGQGSSVRRNRSVSDPQRGTAVPVPRLSTRESYMPDVAEETLSPTSGIAREQFPREQPSREQFPAFEETITPESSAPASQQSPPPSSSGWRGLRRTRTSIGATTEKDKGKGTQAEMEYEEDLVDLLDLVDPEVSTLQTLTNVQNSLFIPDLGKYLNRRPTYNLTKRPTNVDENTSSSDDDMPPQPPPKTDLRPVATRKDTGATMNTISSHVNDRYFAVLPHGVSVSEWSEEEKLELNDHVRHMLHSRRSKFRRSMKGFKQYISKPLGFFVTFYAFSITAFGLAWVLFLIGWINVGGSREDYLVNIIDNVLVALFAIMGDGLAPFRCIDTYHMCYIAHYHHLTWRLRREQALPKLSNHNDLPAVQPNQVSDVEKQEFSVLNERQVKNLAHHQKKFARSHSFYKPHETSTHYAFPLRLLVAIVVLLDCHSILQIALGTCTWAISYHVRPFALTTVILCCSITVNITAGVLIAIGDRRTRKKDVRERMLRQEMTADAIKKVEKKRRHELKKAGLIGEGEPKESVLAAAEGRSATPGVKAVDGTREVDEHAVETRSPTPSSSRALVDNGTETRASGVDENATPAGARSILEVAAADITTAPKRKGVGSS